MIPQLEVRKLGRRWCITAGKARLASHPTQEAAASDLDGNRSLYEFWAGSAGVSIANTPARTVSVPHV